MTREEFKKFILEEIKVYPDDWRQGQKIFNYIDEYYGVARDVQYEDCVDCFFVSTSESPIIDEFIDKAYNRIYSK